MCVYISECDDVSDHVCVTVCNAMCVTLCVCLCVCALTSAGSEQSKQVVFAPSAAPAFANVPQNNFVEPFVLNPGTWTVVIEAEGVLLVRVPPCGHLSHCRWKLLGDFKCVVCLRVCVRRLGLPGAAAQRLLRSSHPADARDRTVYLWLRP